MNDKWEYKTVEVGLGGLYEDGFWNSLTELGNKGWEAYSAFPKFPHSEKIVVMLKRRSG